MKPSNVVGVQKTKRLRKIRAVKVGLMRFKWGIRTLSRTGHWISNFMSWKIIWLFSAHFLNIWRELNSKLMDTFLWGKLQGSIAFKPRMGVAHCL